MPKHIKPYNNKNQPIVDVDDPTTPLVYFNRVCLKKGEVYENHLEKYESCYVLESGDCDIIVDGTNEFMKVGGRNSVWDANPDSVYVPMDSRVKVVCLSEQTSFFIAGGIATKKLEAFAVRPKEIKEIQYGSDDTKTHRKIKHILGQNVEGKVDRLLVSELFTVGKGGWSGFPSHKHDTERPPIETRFEEVYYFKFNPEKGFGAQFATLENEEVGEVHHIRDGSVFLIDYGYHPCVAAPGYQMYYFTIIVGEHQRSLIQFFHPDHEEQVHTIPGIKDMIAGFK